MQTSNIDKLRIISIATIQSTWLHLLERVFPQFVFISAETREHFVKSMLSGVEHIFGSDESLQLDFS